jgi:uroporphyrin-3 C-methyltransferase
MANSNEVAAEAVPASRGGSAWPAVLAILIALIAVALAGFSAWQFMQVSYVPGALNSTTAEFAGIEAQLEKLSDTQAEQQEAIRDLEALLNQAVAPLENLPLRIEQLETLVQSVPGINADRRADWLTAEALYYLKLANAQASLAGNAEVAASALQLADEKLRESGDPRMTAVRAQLSDEITALRAIPTVDRAGISFRLQSLVTQAPDWPMRVQAPTSFRPEVVMPEGDLGPWERFKQTLTAVFDSIISVKKVAGDPVVLQLSVAERALVLENVKSELQIARLAFLANNDALFKQALENSASQIQKYFDGESEAVAAALATLDELSSTAFPGQLPDISESLAMFLAAGERQ